MFPALSCVFLPQIKAVAHICIQYYSIMRVVTTCFTNWVFNSENRSSQFSVILPGFWENLVANVISHEARGITPTVPSGPLTLAMSIHVGCFQGRWFSPTLGTWIYETASCFKPRMEILKSLKEAILEEFSFPMVFKVGFTEWIDFEKGCVWISFGCLWYRPMSESNLLHGVPFAKIYTTEQDWKTTRRSAFQCRV